MSQMEYGVLLPPGAGAVALAQRAEKMGFDLVLLEPGEHGVDPWTLLAWIAGATERVRLAPLGLDLAQWQPTVLGRAAASLDLLSDGRLELGLAESEAASISEAVDVIRAMLAGGRRPVHHRGSRYTVDGAQPGPLPRHHIPLWLSGDADLAAAKADVWLASTPGALASGADLAEAAKRAGRDPEDIRRAAIVNSLDAPPAGCDIVIVPAALLEQVRIPAARAPRVTRRPSAARAQRRPGIAYDDLPASLASGAVEPGDIDYDRVRSTYLRGGSPGLVLRPSTTDEVVAALAFARRHLDLPLGVRSGGHGVSGRSTNDGGIVIDLGRLNRIEIIGDRRARVGPGARWKQVAAALAPHGWALTSGDYGGVGVGGLATAAGIGLLGRQQGLTIDHLRAVEIVLADGSVTRASATENPDLFWAVRGAGANFGIVTSFEFEVDAVPEVGWAQLLLDAGDLPRFLEDFGRVATTAPRDTTAFLVMGPPRRGQPAVAQLYAIVASDEPETVVARLTPFAGIAPLYDHQIVITSYSDVMNQFPDTPHEAQGEPVSRSAFVPAITPAFARDVAALLRTGVVYFFQLRTVGGAIADIDKDATAYAHRDAAFQVTALGGDRRTLDLLWDGLRPHFDGLYLSFETDPRPERLLDAFPAPTLARLRKLKRRYDPDNIFRDNFNIRD